MKEKQYKVNPPLGNHLIPKEVMTEAELREYALQILPRTADSVETWNEKIAKDPIEDVVTILSTIGYTITTQES